MKKIIILGFLILFLISQITVAQQWWQDRLPRIKAKSLEEFLQNLALVGFKWLYTLSLILGVFLLIFAGIKFILSGDNSQEIDKAKDIIKYAIVGIIIAILSYSIVLGLQKSLEKIGEPGTLPQIQPAPAPEVEIQTVE